MAKGKGSSARGRGNATTTRQEPSARLTERELVVVAKPDAGLRVSPTDVASVTGASVSSLETLLVSEGVTLTPLFGESEDRLKDEAAAMAPTAEGEDAPDLSVFYRVDAPDERLEDLCERFLKLDVVEAAYIKPPAEPATAVAPPERETETEVVNDMVALEEEAPPATADFTSRQGYLNAAPAGVDARYAWRFPGGKGHGVRIIDIEGAWRFSHEDLIQRQGGVVGGTPTSNLGWENHGTAVVGEIGADENTFGATGICPNALVSALAIFGIGVPAAFRTAANRLRPGDIMLIELHRVGPRGRYLPMEFWPDEFAAIRYAVTRGVIVVEAGGNGGENLDDPFYNNRPAGFPASWKNPFNPANPNSGAVMVGAGAPPPGTHGNNHGPDRSRLGFSNYGSRLDVQGWGREVTTTGYGDLQGGANRDQWYTDQFSGTSSASPIVVGTLGCVQGILRRRRRLPLSPARARQLLRATGSPQTNAPGRPRTQRIGNRPNLRHLIARALRSGRWLGVQFVGTLPGNAARRWFTHSWPAHWHVDWTVVPTTPQAGGPQIQWNVQVQRTSDRLVSYWITVRNLTATPVTFQARYAMLGW